MFGEVFHVLCSDRKVGTFQTTTTAKLPNVNQQQRWSGRKRGEGHVSIQEDTQETDTGDIITELH